MLEGENMNITKLVLVLACCFAVLMFGCGNGQSKTAQKANSSNEIKTVEAKTTKSIPDKFVPINVLKQVIYVPKEYKKMEIPNQNSEAGVALMGGVWKKVENPKDAIIEHYDVTVMYEKAADLRKMKPYEEDQVLEIIFKNSWNAMMKTAKVATKKELVSKEICKNIDGHKYLKAVSINGNPNKPHLDMVDRTAIYIFDDTIYFVSTNELVRANNKYAKEIDSIFDSFGVRN